jgi:hypothetical protein
MKMFRRFLSPLVASLFVFALLSQAGIASAAGRSGKGQDTVSKVVEINRQALAQMQAGKYDAARDALWNAIAILTDANLGEHAIAARTHVHLAAVYMTGFNDRTKAIRQFVLALKIDPNIKITPQVETAALDEAFDTAHGQGGQTRTAAAPPAPAARTSGAPATSAGEDHPTSAASGSATGASVGGRRGLRGPRPFVDREEPAPPARVPEPFYCPLPSEVPPKEDILVRCVTQKKPRGASATIFYRESGSENFTPLPMTRSPKGWLTATVPAAAVTGSAFQYYLEAKVPGTKEPLTIGTADGPNLMPIIEGAASVNNTLLAMLLQGKDTSMRTGPVGDDNAPLEDINKQYQIDEDLRKYHRRLPGSVFISVGGGAFGQTYQLKTRPDSHELDANTGPVKINAGYLPASLFQLVFELGYQFTDRFALSLQTRYQYTPPNSSGWLPENKGAHSPPTSAVAFFLRGQYSFLTLGNFQTFASGTAGGGQRTFLGYIEKTCNDPNGSSACPTGKGHSDTLSGGPVAVGAGVGMMYHLSRWFAIWVEGRGMASLAPFAVLAEFNGGLAFAYKIERSAPPPSREEGGWERPPGEQEKPEAPPSE